MSATRERKVYGVDGHRQRESFYESYKYDFLRQLNTGADEWEPIDYEKLEAK